MGEAAAGVSVRGADLRPQRRRGGGCMCARAAASAHSHVLSCRALASPVAHPACAGAAHQLAHRCAPRHTACAPLPRSGRAMP